MALRINPLGSAALQNDGQILPVILQCRTPQGTNPKGHWGPNYFFIKSTILPKREFFLFDCHQLVIVWEPQSMPSPGSVGLSLGRVFPGSTAP